MWEQVKMPNRHFLRSDIFTVAIERNSFFRLFDKICYNIFMILIGNCETRDARSQS